MNRNRSFHLILVGILSACGSERPSDSKNIMEAKVKGSPEMVSMSLSLVSSEAAAASLAAPELTFSGEVSGCASGFSQTVSETSAPVSLMKNDSGCRFLLRRMSLSGEVFDFAAIADWSTGQTFSVVGSGGTTLLFLVQKNLDAKLSAPQSVTISYGQSKELSPQNVSTSVSAAVSLASSAPIPMSVGSVELTSIASNGAGVFKASLNCDVPVTGAGTSAACGVQPLSRLVYGFAVDSSPTVALSLATCRTKALAGNSAGVIVPANTGSGLNGGLSIPSMTGPAPLQSYPNLLFTLADSVDASRCLYVRVSIPAFVIALATTAPVSLTYAEGGASVEDPDSGTFPKFYIDSVAGNDANPGTLASPWKTIAKVSSYAGSTSARAGAHYLFKRGSVWNEPATDFRRVNGTDGARVVFGAYGPLTNPKPSLGALQFWGASYFTVRDLKVLQIMMRGNSDQESDGTRYGIIFNNEVTGQGKQGIVGLKKTNHMSIVSNYLHDVGYESEDIIVLHSESWNAMTSAYDIGGSHWIVDNTVVLSGGAEDGIDIDSEHQLGENIIRDFKVIGNRIMTSTATGVSQTGIQVGHWGEQIWVVGNTVGGVASYDALRLGGYNDTWNSVTEAQNYYQVSGNVVFYNDSVENYENNIRVNHDYGAIYHNTLLSTQNPRGGNCVQYHTVKGNTLKYNLMSGAGQLVYVRNSTVAEGLVESDFNWYSSINGVLNFLQEGASRFTLPNWITGKGRDANSGSGPTPGVAFPDLSVAFNQDPRNWNSSQFLEFFTPDSSWAGNNGLNTPGAFTSTGERLGVKVEPLNGNVGWEGPPLVRQKMKELGISW